MSGKSGFNRRQFLAGTAAATAFTIIPRHVLGAPGQPSANEKLNIAGVGVGGMGSGDIQRVPTENIVAICDVDADQAARAAKPFPAAKIYSDFRQMLDTQKDIDAVMVATPDHNHAVVTMAALKMGKHVFCQKPLTHSVHEAMEIAKAAKEANVATQMGNQGQAERRGSTGLRVYLVRRVGAGARDPLLVESPARYLSARHSAAERNAAGAGASELGPVARPVTSATVSSLLPSFRLARLVGFWDGRAGRHRLPQSVGRVQGPETRLARERGSLFHALECSARDQE